MLAPFQTFRDPVLIRMRDNAAAYILAFWQCSPVKRPAGTWLTFLGHSGTGKTMLAGIITSQWPATYICPALGIHQSRYAEICHWPKFVRDCKSGEKNISTMVNRLIDAPFLFVDEIGASQDKSGFIADLLCQVVSGRVRRPTVWTGNITMDALQAIDERISSRMLRDGNVVVECDTKDFGLR